MKQEVPWRRFAVEAIVIVSSILLALAIESWWEERNDRVLESELLSSLKLELIEAKNQYIEYGANLAENMKYGYESIQLIDSSDSDLPVQEKANQIASAVGPEDKFFPPRAALNDILNNGGITIIESQEIRQAISNYEQILALDLSTQNLLEDLWLTQITPYRYKFGRLGVNFEELEIRVESNDAVPEAYVDNLEYRNIIVARILRTENIRIVQTEVIGAIDVLLNLLPD
jgi:hypothetical protein